MELTAAKHSRSKGEQGTVGSKSLTGVLVFEVKSRENIITSNLYCLSLRFLKWFL